MISDTISLFISPDLLKQAACSLLVNHPADFTALNIATVVHFLGISLSLLFGPLLQVLDVGRFDLVVLAFVVTHSLIGIPLTSSLHLTTADT